MDSWFLSNRESIFFYSAYTGHFPYMACIFILTNMHFNFSSFRAEEARMLRVAVGSFFDFLILVTDTIREFGGDQKT